MIRRVARRPTRWGPRRAAVCLCAAAAVTDAGVLTPGAPVERELAAGQTHAYRLALNAGQYLHVTIERRGIDVAVVLRGPDGAPDRA
jgi:hypothetical protein